MPSDGIAAHPLSDIPAHLPRPLHSFHSITNVDGLQNAYHELELEEARIDGLIARALDDDASNRHAEEKTHVRSNVDARFASLGDLLPALLGTVDRLAPAQAVIDATAANAGAISARVRYLDGEVAAVEQALQLVDDTTLLRLRLAELQTAMAAKDIDVAAALIHKYIGADAAALTSPFARFAVQDSAAAEGAVADTPAAIISTARSELVERVSFMFDTAVDSGNTRDIARCFRLFPLLGEDVRGLDKYADFLCATLADKSRVAGDASAISTNLYALRITRLFETAALIVDSHFPLVETHYGPGRMLRVIQRLHIDACKRAAMILDFFEDERHIRRRLAQIQTQTRTQPQLTPTSHDTQQLSEHDFRDATNILAELVLIERQIAAFSRFVESRAAPERLALDREGAAARDRVLLTPEAITRLLPTMSMAVPMQSGMSAAATVLDATTGLVATTPLSVRQEWITDTYVAFESFFVARSAAKLMALDDTDAAPGWAQPITDESDPRPSPAASTTAEHISLTSSCVEDMFFVAKTALEHAIATQQPAAVAAVCQLAIGTLNSVFLPPLEARALAKWPMLASAPTRGLGLGVSKANSASDTAAASAAAALSPQAAAQRSILVSLNNLDLAATYLGRTVKALRSRVDSEWARIPEPDAMRAAQDALDTVAAFAAKFTHARQRALDQIGAHVLKPWMRAILQQSYRDIKYVLTDEEFNDVQNDNLFQKRFTLKFAHLARQLRLRLTPANLAAALSAATSSLATDWERAIRQSKFNMLGGIMFEKDVREIQRYLEREAAIALRPRFARLVQMADVLAVENVADALHVCAGLSGSEQPAPTSPVPLSASLATPTTDAGTAAAAGLSRAEVRALLANRIDIAEKDIAALPA
ncbi:Golgi transport complex subunit 4 [Coemansia sp. Benny D115]|nr:Golgi transport complex subunit 4 [Coemansia sp. Benny D115]